MSTEKGVFISNHLPNWGCIKKKIMLKSETKILSNLRRIINMKHIFIMYSYPFLLLFN